MCLCQCVELWARQAVGGIQMEDKWPGRGIMASTERERATLFSEREEDKKVDGDTVNIRAGNTANKSGIELKHGKCREKEEAERIRVIEGMKSGGGRRQISV